LAACADACKANPLSPNSNCFTNQYIYRKYVSRSNSREVFVFAKSFFGEKVFSSDALVVPSDAVTQNALDGAR